MKASIKSFRAQPFCAVCGTDRPEGRKEAHCVPCLNRGHSYRLVADEKDRLWRINLWLRFYSEQGYTDAEIRDIPHFMRLINSTMSKLRSKEA